MLPAYATFLCSLDATDCKVQIYRLLWGKRHSTLYIYELFVMKQPFNLPVKLYTLKTEI